ncbi:hypothetical protein C5167_041363 [Papaver somniferum]|nr:hypothetical protein C5167_041363 [Papaver somniferum]
MVITLLYPQTPRPWRSDNPFTVIQSLSSVAAGGLWVQHKFLRIMQIHKSCQVFEVS